MPPRSALVLAATAGLAACVPVPSYMLEDRPSTTITSGVYRDLEPGAKEESGLHFKVRAYGSQRPAQILQLAEVQYERIMHDTGLYSFSPKGLYQIVVYGNADEFQKKTQYAPWAVALTVGNAIYAYDGEQLGPAMAHEMSHVIFHEYMSSSRVELRWLNEGLAVYQEARAAGGSAAPLRLRQEPMAFNDMVQTVPVTERERQVALWYRQVGDVVGFMIERGGRLGFGQLLKALRDGQALDPAIQAGFPGVWGSARELEQAWRRKVADAGN
ncbi:MAG: hypothetical protein HY554_18885 [Elusimicrobia bacterium]|nr:hypothetical protein [Elusimicrobiota bacterium]